MNIELTKQEITNLIENSKNNSSEESSGLVKKLTSNMNKKILKKEAKKLAKAMNTSLGYTWLFETRHITEMFSNKKVLKLTVEYLSLLENQI